VVPRSVHLFTDLTTSLGKTQIVGRGATAYRALITIIDEMTEGEVTRRTEIYELERQLVTLQFNLYSTNKLHQDVYHSEVDPTPTSGEFMLYLSRLINIQMFCIEEIKADYVALCDLYGRTPDQTLMTDGYIEFADLGLATTLAVPTYKYHYQHGDMSRVRETHEVALDHLSRALVEGFRAQARDNEKPTE
jgi:hypothetical protein